MIAQMTQLHNEIEAIKQAVEVGYPKKSLHIAGGFLFGESTSSVVFSDPAFWQALSKARGWETQFDEDKGFNEEWKHHALRYFETKLQNGDLTKFWESLP